MPRQLRIEFPGAYYHVMCRGDRREDIFLGDQDRELFIKTLAEACERTGWKIHAWVLMSNHYHWLLETPEANLVEGMKWFQNTYTRRFNSRNKLWGHLFGGRYKSILVEEGVYYQTLIDYIHLNPIRAGLVGILKPEDLLKYGWSSLSAGYMQSPRKRPNWLVTHHRLGASDGKDVVKDRRGYLNHLHRVVKEEGRQAGKKALENQGAQSTLTRGWYWGSQEFRERLEKMIEKLDSNKPGPSSHKQSKKEVPKHGTQEASRLLLDGMKTFGVKRQDLLQSKGSYLPKVVIAYAIHMKTSASQKWIADRLAMKSPVNVSQQIRRLKNRNIKMGKAEKQWLNSVNISS